MLQVAFSSMLNKVEPGSTFCNNCFQLATLKFVARQVEHAVEIRTTTRSTCNAKMLRDKLKKMLLVLPGYDPIEIIVMTIVIFLENQVWNSPEFQTPAVFLWSHAPEKKDRGRRLKLGLVWNKRFVEV